MLKKRYYIACLLFWNLFVGFSQKMNLQKFSVKEGLIQSTVKQIEQDAYGNLWLATSNGLSKFNGKSFENFTTTHGLPSNEISSLLFSNDLLFIGTKKGFCSYNGNKIDTNKLYQKIKGNVKKILERKNILHVITTRGYYTIDINRPTYILDSIAIPSITNHGPTDAEFDEDGNVWISTSNRGVFFIENTISTKIPKFVLIESSISSAIVNNKLIRIANFNSGNLFKGESITSIEFDHKQNLYVSDWSNGVAQIKFDKINQSGFTANYLFEAPEYDKFTKINRFTNIEVDDEGNIFLASDGFGFIKIPIDKNINENDFSPKHISVLNSEHGFFGNNPMCFHADKTNLWVGTLYDGLILMNDNSSMSYNKNSGLAEEKVVSVYKSSDSSIWCGTHGGGAFKYKNKQFTRCFWEDGISESIIKTITEDSFGNIWLGTIGGGISVVSKENSSKNKLTVSKLITEENKLSNIYVSFLYKDQQGAIWVGYQGDNVVDRITVNKDLSFSITPFPITNLSSFNVSCITEDDNHYIWITSNDGVWILDPRTGHVNNEFSVFKNVQTIAKDWNGNMWLGTSDVGAIILKNKLKARYFENSSINGFEKLTTENGVSSNCINTILYSKESVWLISNNGINEIRIDTYLNKIKEIKTYNKGNGFASYDNKPNTAVFDNNQTIWIGSVDGLTQYQNLKENTELLNQKNLVVYINAVNIENKSINWADNTLFTSGEYSSIKFDGYFNWYKIPKNLQLSYTHNSVQFVLNTNDIANQNQINYNYKLIGYDKDWNTLYNFNEITYRNLPSGDYSLIIKASITNDFSTSQEFTYYFSIKPPFWKRTSFYVILLVIVVMSLYYYISGREKRLKREKLKLELEVKARTSEIEKKKKEIEIQSALIQGINNDLTDSIRYAQRIQKTILPDTDILSNYFSEHFIYYKPRNIVSGDYYWIKEHEGKVYVAVVDCTGHGVPGAFMSLITSSILNESFDEQISQYSPAKMMEYLRREVTERVSQNVSDRVNDGLDISLICYDKEKRTIEYVNANRPLYIISNNELITLASENVSIGGFANLSTVIPSKTITIKKDDLLFLFTDGITDQFGGERNKKYNPARLRQFLLMNDHYNLNLLKDKLEEDITQWQGTYEQTDDILIVGLKI